jgi:ribosomal protein S18 acetylase RimI-like enzyme
MSDEVELRPAVSDDLPALFELHRLVFRSHIEELWGWDEEWQLSRFTQECGSSVTMVIEFAGRTLGYMQTVVDAHQLYIRNIALHPQVQGRGIGAALVRQLQQDAGERGIQVALSVFPTNHRAVKFYERLGFHRTGETDTSITMSWTAA